MNILNENELKQLNELKRSFSSAAAFRRIKMKKWFALLLAGLMVFSLAACGKKETEEDQDVILDLATDEEYVEMGGDYHDSFSYETINGNEAMI